ncbi:MAG: hypothetical protein QM719_07835 [Thermomonas sp.]
MKLLESLFATTLVAGLLTASPAQATTVTRVMEDQGGPACQLSVPTTSTQVRPRASGMRNEGTTSAFVICQFTATSSPFTQGSIVLASIDGADHSVSCTGMSGYVTQTAYFATFNIFVRASDTAGTSVGWNSGYFDPSLSTLPSRGFSVTCNLPPGLAIIGTYAYYDEDVGA